MFNIYNLMSLDICKHLYYCYHHQGNGHNQHLPKFPCILWFLFCFVIVAKTLNMRSTLLTNFAMYTILLTTVTMLYSRSLEFIHLA